MSENPNDTAEATETEIVETEGGNDEVEVGNEGDESEDEGAGE